MLAREGEPYAALMTHMVDESLFKINPLQTGAVIKDVLYRNNWRVYKWRALQFYQALFWPSLRYH
jgi:hypothetical protein